MSKLIQCIAETDSTNRHLERLAEAGSLPDGYCLCADYQTAGSGQGSNSWESADGENLLFSLYITETGCEAGAQFLISQAVSLAIVDVLRPLIGEATVKWPNDIYVGDRKIAGILIKHRLAGAKIDYSIVGIGLNVNQTDFTSDAPNPISMAQIAGRTFDRHALLAALIEAIRQGCRALSQQAAALQRAYFAHLYRREGLHRYRDAAGLFEARIEAVSPTGELCLRAVDASLRRYAFKEVAFIH